MTDIPYDRTPELVAKFARLVKPLEWMPHGAHAYAQGHLPYHISKVPNYRRDQPDFTYTVHVNWEGTGYRIVSRGHLTEEAAQAAANDHHIGIVLGHLDIDLVDDLIRSLEWFVREDDTQNTDANRYWINGLEYSRWCLSRLSGEEYEALGWNVWDEDEVPVCPE